jgi:hypothetical protein
MPTSFGRRGRQIGYFGSLPPHLLYQAGVALDDHAE